MYFVSTLLLALFATVFEPSIDRAFISIQNNDWTSAASALDEAFSQDPQTFDANNFHYLRGRIAENQNDWMRLFLMPGMGHCRGGVGPDQADFLGAIERWRESGEAPARIAASRAAGNGRTAMRRPLCPYPQIAKYTGTGSTDDAKNFECVAP